MGRLKVLPLEKWMMRYHNKHLIHMRPRCKGITPVFNRNGYYCKVVDRGSCCWFEVDGKAYRYSDTNFRYTLKMCSHQPLPKPIVKAYTTILKSGYCERGLAIKLRDKLRTDEDWKAVAHTKRLAIRRRLIIKERQNETNQST